MTPAPDRPVRVHVHLDHGRVPRPPRSQAEPSEATRGGVYGYQWAEELCDLRFSENHQEGRIGRFVRRGLKLAVGFDLLHALHNRRALREADVIWTHTEREHLALGLLVRLRLLPPTPTIAQSIWLWDDWHRRGPLLRAFVRWVQHPGVVQTTHSRLNAEVASEALGARAHCVPFGVGHVVPEMPPRPDDDAQTREVRVTAPGSDRDRDWPTLRRVLDTTPEVRLLVLSGRGAARRSFRGAKPRARVEYATSRQRVLDGYAWADVVAVPLRHNTHASGISTAFEALMAGRAAVVSSTGGLSDYLGDLVQYAEVGDDASFSHAVLRAASQGAPDPALARDALAARGLRGDDYARRHVHLSHFLLGTDLLGADLDAVDAFKAVPPPPVLRLPIGAGDTS